MKQALTSSLAGPLKKEIMFTAVHLNAVILTTCISLKTVQLTTSVFKLLYIPSVLQININLVKILINIRKCDLVMKSDPAPKALRFEHDILIIIIWSRRRRNRLKAS